MQPEQLGPYRIGKQLGKGGMGTVFEGCHVDTGERVAIKILSPPLAASAGFRERFASEIESLKKLRHASIVRLYGYGEQDGCLYFSMELVVGSTLDHRLRSGPRFDWREVTAIGIQVSRALKHAHDHGVIHRDIKPANLLVSDRGEVKLSDFGIARIFGGDPLTAAGGVLGTAEYMAPEQADGRTVDARCDQYSLGCVLYALLAGRPPFRASGLPELLQLQRFAEPEPVRSFAPATPEELDRIIMQLLEKDPARRLRNTLVLARRLEAMNMALARMENQDPEGSARGTGDPNRTNMTALEETRGGSESHAGSPSPAEPDAGEAGRPVTGSVMAASEPHAGTGQAAPMPVDENRFTSIEEAELRDETRAREPSLQSVAQALLLLVGLALLVTVVWYFARSQTADGLSADIAAAVGDGNGAALLEVEDAIDEFVRRFPHDPRTPQMVAYQQEVWLLRTDRRLHGQARHGQRDATLTPGQQLYVTALRLAETHPDEALVRLEAILDLYEGSAADAGGLSGDRQHQASAEPQGSVNEGAAGASPAKGRASGNRNDDAGKIPGGLSGDVPPAHLLILARRRIELLQEQVGRNAREHREMLERRLDDADRIRADDVSRAQRIWRGVVRLYQDKTWAADLVARARSELAATDAQVAAEQCGE